jgi:predicted DNA-binding transcriptional regulator YafY
MTATELADRLDVTVRTIYRDLDALSAAGVPVFAERGIGGGVALPDGYRLNLTALNRQEASALFLSAQPGSLADLGAEHVLEAALQKLSAALPSATRQEAEHARQRLHLDPASWWRAPEPVPYLQVIQESVWHDRRLRLTYGRPGRPPRERLVEPYGLVAKASIWYLVAAQVTDDPSETDQAPNTDGDSVMRMFRVSRILSAEPTRETFRRPADFDLAACWERWCTEFEQSKASYAVILRVQPSFVPVLPTIFGEGIVRQIAERGQTEEDGALRLPLTFESIEVACGQIISAGPMVEVVSPPELRARLAQQAAGIYAIYGTDGNPHGISSS